MTRLIIFALTLLSCAFIHLNAQHFETDFETASRKAREEQKTVMMVFSGSDWCKPCILLKKEVLSSEAFSQFASENLVMLNLDFPYRKQNQLPKEQQAHNEALAEQYNPKGVFPLVLLLNPDGSVAQQVPYQTNMSPESFQAQIHLPQPE